MISKIELFEWACQGLTPASLCTRYGKMKRKYHKYESRKIFINEVIIPGHITCICTIHLYIDLKKNIWVSKLKMPVEYIILGGWFFFSTFKIKLTRYIFGVKRHLFLFFTDLTNTLFFSFFVNSIPDHL